MKFRVIFIIIFFHTVSVNAHVGLSGPLTPGYELRIREFIDSLRIIDSHEHLFDPEALKTTNFLDFTLLLHQNSYDDLVSSGMPGTAYDQLFNTQLSAKEKWDIVKPYWKNAFNTSSNRVIRIAIRDLYGISDLNDSTVEVLSSRIKEAYNGDWFNHVLKDRCRFDYVLQETDFVGEKSNYFRYTDTFSDWLTVKTKYRIDSLAVTQLEPIYTLENYVSSMRLAFEGAIKMGMVAVKINIAYSRPLNFDNVSADVARKVFRTLINGNESFGISYKDAKPLQDYMLHKLLDMAKEYNLPVAFHTGLQAGKGNVIGNSDPSLLINLFFEYPDVNFVLYHSSYPYGGTLSALAKNFPNVYIDMNWTYSISPSYAQRYLNEWLETVPASKIMAFGGDQRCVENTYGELVLAKEVISDVLIGKVKDGYISEPEAKAIAKKILYDNGVKFYKLK
jgi:hypothetical protein